jgi:hypothetical protein
MSKYHNARYVNIHSLLLSSPKIYSSRPHSVNIKPKVASTYSLNMFEPWAKPLVIKLHLK